MSASYVPSMLWRSPSPRRHPPGFIEPCLPTLGHTPPAGPQWAYEIKHDGYPFICCRDGDRVRVFSRRGYEWTDRVPLIAEALAKLRVKSVTIDGEGVVCRPDGVCDFDRLRAAVGRMGSRDAFLYAFDLLELDGNDLRRDAWEVRRATLTSLLRKASKRHPAVRTSRQHRRRDDLSARLRHGIGRHRRQAPGSALSFGAITGLDQGQEPGRAGCNPIARRVGATRGFNPGSGTRVHRPIGTKGRNASKVRRGTRQDLSRICASRISMAVTKRTKGQKSKRTSPSLSKWL